MGKTTCFISLGSNMDGDKYLKKAQQQLERSFPDIRYSEACLTPPVAMHNPSFFLNQIAVFHTSQSLCEVKSLLKQAELACAPLPKDKLHEQIYIDIDLLQFGDEILKAEDLKRAYVREGMERLSSPCV